MMRPTKSKRRTSSYVQGVLFLRFDPSFWTPNVRFRTEVPRVGHDGKLRDRDIDASRYKFTCDGETFRVGVSRRLSWDGRTKSEGFVDDGVEDGEVSELRNFHV